ncbi:MAG: nucleotidyltransferase family protein [Prevotella sp.]|nr:nucleotidyltransferase family protein [Prevotella sp.]
MMDSICLFELLRYAIGKSDICNKSIGIDWDRIYGYAQGQGVTALVFDAIDRSYSSRHPLNIGFKTKMNWIGDVQQMEAIYDLHKNIIINLAKFYQQCGIRMMLLKGIGLSYDYPIPNHRPCGDIDIYLYGDLKRGDRLIKEQFGVTIDTDYHKHTVFELGGVKIENHYDFANYHKHWSSKRLDKWLKQEAENSYHTNNNIWLPSPNFNAIFLVRHAASHFAAEGITIRHLLDWAFFVEKHYNEVDWEWQWKICKEQNMNQFLLAVNNICVRYLGFDNLIFRTGGDENLTERILNDILQPEFQEKNPTNVLPYVLSRGKRWWANRWKHRIVYPEGMLTTLFSQISAHLMKPATLGNNKG